MKCDVAFIESFEAEQNTQITSAEEARQRIQFERKENLSHSPHPLSIGLGSRLTKGDMNRSLSTTL